MTPRQIIVKVMTVSKPEDRVFVMKSVTKGDNDWWEFDHIIAGKGKIKVMGIREFGILDREFVGGGLQWKVYVRVVPNEKGSTATWTFMRPDGLTDDQMQEQIKGFDMEVTNGRNIWKKIEKPDLKLNNQSAARVGPFYQSKVYRVTPLNCNEVQW
jgi:hypothetical protein